MCMMYLCSDSCARYYIDSIEKISTWGSRILTLMPDWSASWRCLMEDCEVCCHIKIWGKDKNFNFYFSRKLCFVFRNVTYSSSSLFWCLKTSSERQEMLFLLSSLKNDIAENMQCTASAAYIMLSSRRPASVEEGIVNKSLSKRILKGREDI